MMTSREVWKLLPEPTAEAARTVAEVGPEILEAAEKRDRRLRRQFADPREPSRKERRSGQQAPAG